MKLVIVESQGEKDITSLINRVVLSGEYSQVARKLEFTLTVSPNDYYLDNVSINTGDIIRLYDDGVQLFEGYVFSKERAYSNDAVSITSYDGGIYLLKNEGAYNFKATTAENIASIVCNDFEIPIGSFAQTDILQNIVCIGESLYNIIMKAYTKAAEQNGKKYLAIMAGGKFHVIERGDFAVDYVLENGKDLTDSSYSESIENMVNTVKIVDDVGTSEGDTITWKE